MSGKFGATVLTDCKNGSDKPNDHMIRLTLIRTPGVRGGYPDQATQDLGHHEFVYGIAGHAGGWRDAHTDWQAQRLNAPLIAFETSKHEGALGNSFSLLKVSNPRIRVLAVKKAETYRYSYLSGYPIDVPPGTKTIKLPQNDRIRILAISTAEESPAVKPAGPLYDVLPSPNAQPGDMTYAGSLPETTLAATRVN